MYKKENLSINVIGTNDNDNDDDYNVYNTNYDGMIKQTPALWAAPASPSNHSIPGHWSISVYIQILIFKSCVWIFSLYEYICCRDCYNHWDGGGLGKVLSKILHWRNEQMGPSNKILMLLQNTSFPSTFVGNRNQSRNGHQFCEILHLNIVVKVEIPSECTIYIFSASLHLLYTIS